MIAWRNLLVLPLFTGVAAFALPVRANAQDSCANLRNRMAQLEQQVRREADPRSGVPREQVKHNIDLYDRLSQIYRQRCSGGGGVAGGGGGRSNALGAAIQMLGVLAPLFDAAARVGEADRQRRAQAEYERLVQELDRQREALAEVARLEAQARAAGEASVQRQAQAQQESDRAWREAQTNPFAASTAKPPPAHEIRTFPGQRVETALAGKPQPPASAPQGCPSDTTSGGRSLSPECMKPPATAAHSGQAGAESQPGRSDTVTGTGGDRAIAHVDATNPGGTPARQRTPAAGRGEQREIAGVVQGGAGNGRDINVAVGNPSPLGRIGSGSSPTGPVLDAGNCIRLDGFTKTLSTSNGTSGYFTASNRCGYRVFGVVCYKRVTDGEFCANVGGPPNWSERIAFAYADTPGGRISYSIIACRSADESNADCIGFIRKIYETRNGGRQP